MPVPAYLRRREKVFGPGRAVPLDRNAKARILAYAKAWSARHRQPRQHKGPITRAFLEVLEALEWAGVLSWQNRIAYILVRERDLFGRWTSRRQVIRTSNAYVFRDPKPGFPGGFPCKSENPTGTLNQEVLSLERAPAPDPKSPLERALRQLGGSIEERLLLNGSGGTVEAS